MWPVYPVEEDLVIKKNELLIGTLTRVNLEDKLRERKKSVPRTTCYMPP